MIAIYEQHDKAFSNVSAYVLCKDGERVGTIAFKHPRDGAGRLYAYVHVHGIPMVRGFAGGGGYDKATAACSSAASKLNRVGSEDWELATAIRDALLPDNGQDWTYMLREAGIDVYQAV